MKILRGVEINLQIKISRAKSKNLVHESYLTLRVLRKSEITGTPNNLLK